MKTANFVTFTAVALALSLSVVGCKKRPQITTPLPKGGVTVAGPTTPVPPDIGRTPGLPEPTPPAPAISIDPNAPIPMTGERSIDNRPQDREIFQAYTVYFDFDRSTVRPDQASKIEEVATKFKNSDPANDLLIEGHCDERGTEEYNRALGERRALALRELIVRAGVEPKRVHTKSFGEDKPAIQGNDESAWSKNRRGEFILVLPAK